MDTAPRLPRGRLCFGDSGILVSQPSPLGKGDRAAVNRVLSLIVDLRRSPLLSFIPLSLSNLRPFGAPPSIGRRECPHEPLPVEGAAERSEAGLASFLSGEAASSVPSPCRESGVILVPSSTTSIALTRASQRGAGSILRLFDRHAFSGGNPLHPLSNVLPHRRRGQDRPARGIPLCGYSL